MFVESVQSKQTRFRWGQLRRRLPTQLRHVHRMSDLVPPPSLSHVPESANANPASQNNIQKLKITLICACNRAFDSNNFECVACMLRSDADKMYVCMYVCMPCLAFSAKPNILTSLPRQLDTKIPRAHARTHTGALLTFSPSHSRNLPLVHSTFSNTGKYRAGTNTCRKSCHVGSEIKFRQTCHAKCDDGFTPETGTKEYTCNAGKKLGHTDFECTGKVAPVPYCPA